MKAHTSPFLETILGVVSRFRAQRLEIVQLLLVLAALLLLSTPAWSQSVSFHPDIDLLDKEGQNVLDSGRPVSTVRSCGECHDTEFIARHSFHADLGARSFDRVPAGASPYDRGSGIFGRFDPNLYVWFEPKDPAAHADTTFDDTVLRPKTPGGVDADELERWLDQLGRWHVGGGPFADRMEPNCFLCHLDVSDNDARLRAMERGQYEWAATATLASTGAVVDRNGQWRYNAKAFDPDKSINLERVRILDPSSRSCGQCHGLAVDGSEPVEWSVGMKNPRTELTGEIFAAQKLYHTRMNLAGKRDLTRPWDVHAERLLDCSSCHHSPNNPIFARESANTKPDHLAFDALKLSIGEYLRHPNHQLVKGHSSAQNLANGLDGSMRRCEDCHDAMNEHAWLPRKERHFRALSCEACHLPEMHAPARMQTDWTVLNQARGPVVVYRGVDGDPNDPLALIKGYRPVLLERRISDEQRPKLFPHNLLSTFYWVGGEPQQPVSVELLAQAYFDESGAYHEDLRKALDSNGDGALSAEELRLDSDAKTQLVSARLQALGVKDPHIVGEIQPYSIHHGAAGRGWATRDCAACHQQEAQVVSEGMRVAAYLPGGVQPAFVTDSNADLRGSFQRADDGSLSFVPERRSGELYVFGFSAWPWVDLFGLLMLVGSFLGIMGHAGLRVYHARMGGS
ncbi:MAG: hypothetical protein RBU37_20170 [Myxococcota bacterium]|jgi:hypothetical protein|nr:hypothetical protein [Myxococcota bacterium]